MKKGFGLLAVAAPRCLRSPLRREIDGTTINGAGSTFVSPLVSLWTPAIGSAFGYTLQYAAVGSAAAFRRSNQPVDFGASDAPLTPDQRRRRVVTACRFRGRFAGGDRLQRSGPSGARESDGATVSKIFLGPITNWDDPAIGELNPGADSAT